MNKEYTLKNLLAFFKKGYSKKNIEGMKRFGIVSPKMYGGTSMPQMRQIAAKIGKNHELALKLWDSEVYEARILASLIADPAKVTESLMEKWVNDFDNWAVCDVTCGELFDYTKYAWKKAVEWTSRKEEYVKRAGFVLMATLAVHDKTAFDSKFIRMLPLITREATDERNFVRKAVNWALRQIGKRNPFLRKAAMSTAREIQKIDSKTAKWIAGDALRELKLKTFKK
jgi:3-methyladenine DNA glycosylase AlkD